VTRSVERLYLEWRQLREKLERPRPNGHRVGGSPWRLERYLRDVVPLAGPIATWNCPKCEHRGRLWRPRPRMRNAIRTAVHGHFRWSHVELGPRAVSLLCDQVADAALGSLIESV
jgi:hypothetical protein